MRTALLTLVLLSGGLPSCDQMKLSAPASTTPEEPEKPQAEAPPTLLEAVGDRVAPQQIRRADYAITKLQLKRAEAILDRAVGPDAARARARLSIYRADCEQALSQLASPAAREAKGAPVLLDLATRCTGATAGAVVVDDKKAGVWLRLQDEADRVLVPLLTEVAVRARRALERDLGVTLPRPLRIDLVRDLFSLSAVSGLPLEAAETTGTVAVARWGRVTMVSPRAMQQGFPWADTLAHEITHLLISRGTADRAPLWLQEGIAKREEHRWRDPQLFDETDDFSKKAHQAQLDGKSIGVDQIGPSIAMLPSADAASIAFAEVTSFMDYWIGENGPRSLEFLLRDMEVAEDADSAMRSVSGYGVSDWQLVWRKDLNSRYPAELLSEPLEEDDSLGPRALHRAMRIAELLTISGHAPEAAELSSVELDRGAHSAALRFLSARAAFLSGREDADEMLGSEEELDGAHAGWLALRASRLSKTASDPRTVRYLSQASGLDPLLPEAACGGALWVGKGTTSAPVVSESDDELCTHSRTLPVRGSR